MSCRRCASENIRAFVSEVAIHFPGLDNLDKPILWVFPELAVCLYCGFSELTVPERELSVLSTGKAVDGVAVLSTNKERKKKRDQ